MSYERLERWLATHRPEILANLRFGSRLVRCVTTLSPDRDRMDGRDHDPDETSEQDR